MSQKDDKKSAMSENQTMQSAGGDFQNYENQLEEGQDGQQESDDAQMEDDNSGKSDEDNKEKVLLGQLLNMQCLKEWHCRDYRLLGG